MSRTFKDDLGTRWNVHLERVDDPTDTVDEEVILRFSPESENEDERQVRAVGALEELFESLARQDLQLAVEAAGNEAGFLFLHPEGHLWWVRRGDEDPLAEGAMITFSDLQDLHQYSGSLASTPETLSEEELQEILDEARGVTSP